MATKDTLFTVVGITTHTGKDANGTVSTRTKVRYGTDIVRLIKMLNNPKKIIDTTLDIYLAPERVDFIELPYGMVKDEALKFLLAHEDFQSPADQATIQDVIDTRTPRTPRVKKTKMVKVKKKTLTVNQFFAALASPTTTEITE